MGSSGGDAGAASTAVLNGAGGVAVIAGDGIQGVALEELLFHLISHD